ncbi:HupE/UreJ family protein [Humisphaera borealis]|uniref:HupE/UreJ family protein n=1 Tax=Humisphaera borealis TaxID=2807512 RepID=A0A7M2X3B5_9BACT|nr:HupE/UreJ family protein [Humisphaera borealis]QOV91922.1 HupE/UreJ family protein [Humisphaera borealis]
MQFAHKVVVGAASLLLVSFAASAHTSSGGGGVVDFRAGANHPFSGLDHVLAMLAVGLIAARASYQTSETERRQRWLLPLSFLIAMIVGGVVALVGGPAQPSIVEHLIAASVIIFGLLLVAAGAFPTSTALYMVPAFAFFHGYAHMQEGVSLGGRGPIGYAMGMIIATLMLLGAGIALGTLMRARTSSGETRPLLSLMRVMGGAVAVMGVALLVRTF